MSEDIIISCISGTVLSVLCFVATVVFICLTIKNLKYSDFIDAVQGFTVSFIFFGATVVFVFGTVYTCFFKLPFDSSSYAVIAENNTHLSYDYGVTVHEVQEFRDKKLFSDEWKVGSAEFETKEMTYYTDDLSPYLDMVRPEDSRFVQLVSEWFLENQDKEE